MKIHYANRVQTRCGKFLTLHYLIETTRDPDKVTCKTCLKSLKPKEVK